MASQLVEALTILRNNLKSTTEGGYAASLSASNYGAYFKGTGSGHFKTTVKPARFFTEAWEIPISVLDGTVSTGHIFMSWDDEKNLEQTIDASLKYERALDVQLYLCLLDEGDALDYEEIIFAMMRDAMRDPYLADPSTRVRKVLRMVLKGVKREQPPMSGVFLVRMDLTIHLKINLV